MKRVIARLLATAGLVVAGLAGGVVLAEALLRLAWHDPQRSAPSAVPPGLRELKTAAELARPNTRGAYNGAVYRSNGLGFRGREYAVPKPPGIFRIVIAGDSVTMGSGVAEEEAYPFLVEEGLRTTRHDRAYEVLNLGLIGLDLRGVLDRLERIGLRFQPDLIVYGCTLNDIKGPRYRSSMHPRGHLAKVARYNRFRDSPWYVLRVLWPRWVSFGELVHPQSGSLLFEQLDNYFDNPSAWADFTAGLARLAAIAQRTGVPAVVFIHTNLEYLNAFHPERRVYARIGEAAAAHGLHTIDSFAVHRGHDAEALWLSVIDAHPNRVGHELLARALLDGLARLPDAYWTGR